MVAFDSFKRAKKPGYRIISDWAARLKNHFDHVSGKNVPFHRGKNQDWTLKHCGIL
jgi:hypothetical protein